MTEYPSYKYSIQANVWYTATFRNPSYSLIYSSSHSFDQDYAVIFGGMYTTSISAQAPLEDCFSNVITIYDMGNSLYFMMSACESFSYVTLEKSYKRAGHSMVIRNDTILIFAGSDGIFRDTVLTIPVPLSNKTTAESDICKGKTIYSVH